MKKGNYESNSQSEVLSFQERYIHALCVRDVKKKQKCKDTRK